MVGVALNWRRRLIVIYACGSSRSQSWSGKLLATLARMLMKWALKLRMATLAALRLWLPGRTSSISMLYSSRMSSFRLAEISLSITCFRGWMFVCLRVLHQFFVRSYHFGILAAEHGIDKYDAAFNVHHDHDVFVAGSGGFWKLPYLVREYGFTYIVDVGVYIALFLPT